MLKKMLILGFMALFLLHGGSAWADDPDNKNKSSNDPWQPPISYAGGITPLGSYASDLQGSVVSPPRAIDNFTMESTLGEDFTFSDYGGNLMLVYFGYMTCPDVCPTTMGDMLRAYREVGEPSDRVKVLYITLDPERDTLDRMTMYTQAFHPDFIGLRTEDPTLLAQVMGNFGVVAEKKEVDSALEYLIDHSATVFLLAPDLRVISQFPYGVSYTEIANDLQVMLDYTRGGTPLAQVMGDVTVPPDPEREFRIVIPPGTGDQIRRGNDPGIIPLEINLTLGVKDILVLENHDEIDYLVGGIWVAPHETVSKQFYAPQTFVGLCTVTVGRDLIEIIVSEPS